MTEEAIMTDEQLQRIHDIEYSCDSREELAERIVGLEDELANWERMTAGIELPEYPITQFQPKDLERDNTRLREENAKLREVIDDITEVVEASDPALVQFIAKRMERAGIEVES